MADINTRISDFVWKNLNEKHINGKQDAFWEALKNTGTELWLDTCDTDEADQIWSSEMSALTTNSSSLYNEIQKGYYDIFITEAKSIVRELPFEEKIKEIAFIITARHGLRLANRFGGYVSVDLHTNTSHDIKAIEHLGRRLHDICPDHFIIKVPYTAEGLIAARNLKDSGVRVNLTLEFSARQNIIVTSLSRPDFVNVFVGRIADYISQNKLGDGSVAGERSVIASQNWVTALSAKNPWQTKLIAASLRNYSQIELLAGTDVITMPSAVADSAHKELKGNFTSRLHENYEVNLYDSAKNSGVEKFWEVDDKVITLAERLASKVPSTANELIKIAHEEGCEDMFPLLSRDEKANITADGKIPIHSKWLEKIAAGKLAPDTLLTLAGLDQFSADQEAVDQRIRSIID